MLRRTALSVLLLTASALAQSVCQSPLPPRTESPLNLFNAQQEAWLGQIMAEQYEADMRVVEDDELNGYLQKITDRLLKDVDTRGLTIKIKLVDSAEVNAFTIADGRVYVMRKLIVAAHSEDEVAGVIAHELGHALTGQIPVDMSRRFRDALKINALSDRADVEREWNLYLENYRRQKINLHKFEREEEQEQTVADQMAIALLARAGYVPQSFADFWDRMSQNKGKTGNALTDFFGSTKPESKRLRKILQQAAALPPNCKTAVAHASPDFDTFRTKATNFSYTESHLANIAAAAVTDQNTAALDPPLRSNVQHIKFSPDGKYLLAQNESSVFVLTREPFAVKFRFDAPRFYAAMFSPDSKRVIVSNRALRIEQWNIEEQKRVAIREMVRPKACMQAVVSPTGEQAACILFSESSGSLDFQLLDTSNSSVIVQKKGIYSPQYIFEIFELLLKAQLEGADADFVNLRFSPDGRYVIAAKHREGFAYDVQKRLEVKLAANVRTFAGARFDWLGPDRIVGINPENSKKSGVLSFPSGQQIIELPFATNSLAGASKGDYMIVGPFKEATLGAVDLTHKKVMASHQRSGMDVYDGVIAIDTAGGDIAIQDVANGQKTALTTQLTLSPLSSIKATAVSPDLRYLGVSLAHNAAVWDLASGKRIAHIRAFSGAYIDANGAMFADFPKPSRDPNSKHEIGQLLFKSDAVEGSTLETIDDDTTKIRQVGRFRFRFTHPQKKQYPVTMTAFDSETRKELWSRVYSKDMPSVQGWRWNPFIVLVSAASEQPAADAIKSSPELQRQLSAMRADKSEIFYFEVVDAATGKTSNRLLIDSGRGSLEIERTVKVGDSLVINDSENRMLIYSLTTGKQIAHFIGEFLSSSESRGMIAMLKNDSELHFIDAHTGEDMAHRSFAAPITLAAYSDDGNRMLVLTNDQKYRMLNIGAKKTATTVAAK